MVSQPSPSVPMSVAGVESKVSRACLRGLVHGGQGFPGEARCVAVDGEQADPGVGAGGDEDQPGDLSIDDE